MMTATWTWATQPQGEVWIQAVAADWLVTAATQSVVEGTVAVGPFAAEQVVVVEQMVAVGPFGEALQAVSAVAQMVAAEQVVVVARLAVAAVAATADRAVVVAADRAAEQVDSRPVAADSRNSAWADHSPAAGRAVAAVHSLQTDSTADQGLASFSCPDCRGCRPRRAVWNGSCPCLCLAMIQNADGLPRRSYFLWSSFWRNSRPDVHR